MDFLGLIFLLLVAILITFVFSFLLRVRGPWGSIWTFFIITLFAVIAAGFWIQPTGPMYRDIYYMPPLVVGILVALLLAAAAPSPRTRSRLEKRNDSEKEEADFYALGIFFWVLFTLMLLILAIGYFSAIAR
jgi:hypothetical protein